MKAFARSIALITLAAATFVSTTAFRSTDIESYVDPAYENYSFESVAIATGGADVELKKHLVNKFTKEFKKLGIGVIAIETILPPTREWTPEAAAAELEQSGVSTILIVELEGYDAGIEVFGATTFTNVNSYSNSARSNTTFQKTKTDAASFSVELVDASNGSKAWVANISTSGGGLLFVGAKSTAGSLVGNVMKMLDKDGLTSNKKQGL